MSTFITVVLLLVAVIVFVAWLRSRVQTAMTYSAVAPNLPLAFRNIAPGDLLHLSRIGDSLDDFDVRIVDRHIYRENGFEWFEFEGEGSEGKVWIEVEEEDELAVSISLRRLNLSDIGLDAEKLATIEQRDEGMIAFEGRRYEFEDWGEAQFLRHGDDRQSEQFKYWDFESEDGKWFLGIERWGEREFVVYLSQGLSPAQYEVYSQGDEE